MQRIEDYSMTMSPWKTGAERCGSAAPNGGSDAGADAIGRRLQCIVRRSAAHEGRRCGGFSEVVQRRGIFCLTLYVLMIVMIFAITSCSFSGFRTPARYRMMLESAVKSRFGRMLLS
jgi:hypothetical protein